MKVIFCQTITESDNWKIFDIVSINGIIYEYPPTKISRELIMEMLWMEVEYGFGLVLQVMRDKGIQPIKVDNLDYLIVKYPESKSTLLPLSRDKKIDDLL